MQCGFLHNARSSNVSRGFNISRVLLTLVVCWRVPKGRATALEMSKIEVKKTRENCILKIVPKESRINVQ
jgi:hypothetical protein